MSSSTCLIDLKLDGDPFEGVAPFSVEFLTKTLLS